MLIRSIRCYTGVTSPSMRGERVVVIAVLRGDTDSRETLTNDAAIGELQPDDRFEVVQIFTAADGMERTTWATADAAVWELGPAEGRWDGPLATGIVVEPRMPGL